MPCQPYSIAGKRKGIEDERGGSLIDKMLEIIGYYMPKHLLLENVPGLLSIHKGDYFKYILKSLNGHGYAVDWITIDSALVSAQSRKRVYIIGRLAKEVSTKELEYEGICPRSCHDKTK